VLGYSRQEVLNTPLKNYYTQDSVQKMLDLGGYQRALKGLFTAEERTFVARNGEHVHTLLHSLPEVHRDGNIGTRAMFVDITERKKAQEQARKLEAALAQSQEMDFSGFQ
jgi:PAS domain S-box-containing protein